MKTSLKIIVASLVIGLIGVLSWRYVYIVKPANDKFAPIVFPLNSEDANYTIVKFENSYSLNYKKKNPQSIHDDLALLIGSTPVDLDQFVGKKIKVTGSFINASPYCKGDCSSIGTGKRPVVKIDTIALAE